jgi:hypothetical protein
MSNMLKTKILATTIAALAFFAAAAPVLARINP